MIPTHSSTPSLNQLYTVRDEFFDRFKDPYLKQNKLHRPHYLYDFNENGLIWVIPTTITDYDRHLQESRDYEEKSGKIDLFRHFAKCTNNEKRVFFVRSIFPITEEYLDYPYARGGVEGFLHTRREIAAIDMKATRFLSLYREGKPLQKYQADLARIEKELLSDIKKRKQAS